jgi:uncharacterized protein YbjQ (UPF0145 family)
MDLYFQGLAWRNRGSTLDNLAKPHSFFDRPLAGDPDNIEALVGSAGGNAVEGALLFVTDRVAAFAAAEAKLTKALSSAPDHARGHALFGFVQTVTRRAAEGIAECEHALELDRNLALAHSFIGIGRVLIGRAEETEAHIAEALRLSPRDAMAYIWMSTAGDAKNHLGSWEQAVAWLRRAIEANRNNPAHFNLAAALAQLGRFSICSLGLTGSFFAAFKSFTRGEISELTRLVHDAREIAINRLKSEADQLGAEDVVGVKTYIAEIGHGLVEFMAIGTAVKKTAGVGVATPALPVQAIVPDKDTWIDGDFGFQLDRAN